MLNIKDFEVEIFKGKTLDSLFKDIYNNSTEKREEIYEVITTLQNTIGTDKQRAILLSPTIVDFMDVAVKNDEQLIKLATVIQKIISSNKRNVDEDGNLILPEAEKEKLLQMAKEMKDPDVSYEKLKEDITKLENIKVGEVN